MPKILVNINGRELEAFRNQTILEVCKDHNIKIPTLCHSEMLENYGSCGICVVEVEGTNKLLRSCSTKIQEGMIVKTSSKRIKESRKTTLELLLSYHTGDCKAPCTFACPGNVDVQGYVGLIANEEYDEALKLIKEKLPLPAAIGRVCPHPCQTGCRRDLIEDSISIAWLKRFVADKDLEKDEPYMPEIKPDKNKKIAVIGGGPGGLSAAFFLRKEGYQVTVYEAMPEFGGMLKYGIPLYRLPKDVLRDEIKLIEKMGVKLIANTRIGESIEFEHIRNEFDAVYVSIGAWKSSIIPCKGHTLNHVHGGIDFLNKFAINEPIKVGKKIAVIGGGNTAMDTCRTAIRLGADKVYVIYRRTMDDMPAVDVEIIEALEEGVESKFLLNPVEILDDGNGNVAGIKLEKMRNVGIDKRGRTKVEGTGEFETLEVESVIMSIGQKLDNSGLEAIQLNDWGNIESHEKTWQTNLEGVFAGGDCANEGADIAIHAIDDGRKAAKVIDSYLYGDIQPIEDKYYVEKKNLSRADFPNVVTEKRSHMGHELPEVRKDNFEEVVYGFTEAEALEEAQRCLECGCKEVFQCDLLEYSNAYAVEPDRLAGEKQVHEIDESHTNIIKDANKCIHCGMCVRICDEVMDLGSLGLVNRGFDTVVLPALNKKLEDTTCISCGQCVNICPTGALQEKMKIQKPVPILPNITHTTCTACSIGCQVNIESKGRLLLRAIPDYYDLTSKGLLCSKGKFDFSYKNENRLLKPMIRKNNALVEVSYEEAILYAARKAQAMELLYGKNALGVSISDSLTNEEIYLSKKYAKEILKTENIFNIDGKKSGLKEVLGIDASTNTLNEIINADVIFNINADLMSDYTIAGLKVKQAYDHKASIINLNNNITKLDDWSELSIIEKNITGTLKSIYEGLNNNKKVANQSVEKALDLLDNNKKVIFIFDENRTSTADEILIASIAKVSGHIGSPRNGIIKLRKNINGQGLVDMGISNDSSLYKEKIKSKEIHGLLLMGNNMPNDGLLDSLDFLMVMAEELTDEIKNADVIFPMASMLESEGTITTNDRRILEINQVIEPRIKYTNLYLIEKLMNVYSRNIKLNSSKEVLEEICRNIKFYHGYLDGNQDNNRWPINSTHILFENENIFALPVHENELPNHVIEIIESIE